MDSADLNSSGICEAPMSATCVSWPSDASESRTDRTGDSLVVLKICFRIMGVEGASIDTELGVAAEGVGALKH